VLCDFRRLKQWNHLSLGVLHQSGQHKEILSLEKEKEREGRKERKLEFKEVTSVIPK
jgi:hypothetical protein